SGAPRTGASPRCGSGSACARRRSRRAAYWSVAEMRERERVRQAAIAAHRAEVLRRQRERGEDLGQEPVAAPTPPWAADPAAAPAPARRAAGLRETRRELRDAGRELTRLLREQRGRGG